MDSTVDVYFGAEYSPVPWDYTSAVVVVAVV